MVDGQSRELILLQDVEKLLAKANMLDEIKEVRDKAEAVRIYAQSARHGLSVQNFAAEIKLRAERKAGRFLRELQLRGGDRKSNGAEETAKLSDYGISKTQSARWQRESLVPEKDFAEYIRNSNAAEREVTAAGLLRMARSRSHKGHSRKRGKREDRSWIDSCQQDHSIEVDGCGHEIVAMLQELRNHCELLADVLEPVRNGRDVLQTGARRAIGTLLVQIEETLTSMERRLVRSSTASWPANRDFKPR